MKTSFSRSLKTAFFLVFIMMVVTGGIYPLFTFLIGQLIFPHSAGGSLLFSPSVQTVVGSSLIGQNFQSDKYLHPRPSAAGPNGYDAIRSGGSNLSVTSQKLFDRTKDAICLYRLKNGVDSNTYVPQDAVTSSGSGLDPHISVENALLQIPRIAKARKVSEEHVLEVVQKCTQRQALGLFGEARVNVLLVNCALDQCYLEKRSE